LRPGPAVWLIGDIAAGWLEEDEMGKVRAGIIDCGVKK
jgi:hypothetical protein